MSEAQDLVAPDDELEPSIFYVPHTFGCGPNGRAGRIIAPQVPAYARG